MNRESALFDFSVAVREALDRRFKFAGDLQCIPPRVIGPVGTCEDIESALRDLDERLARVTRASEV